MPWNPNNQSRFAGLIIAGLIGALLAGALALASVRSTGSALDEAAELRVADLTLSAQHTAMATIGQAVLLAEDLAVGVADPSDVSAATTAATESVASAADLFAALAANTDEATAAAFFAWQSAADEVLAAVGGDDPREAATLLASTLRPATDTSSTRLVVERDARAAAVADAQSGVGAFSRLAGFLVVFLFPFGAILIYRTSARRQLEVAVDHLDARLESEQLATEDSKRFVTDFAKEVRPAVESLRELAQRLVAPGGFLEIDETARLIDVQSEQLVNRIDDLLVSSGDKSADQPPVTFVEMGDQLDAVIAAFAGSGSAVGGTYGRGNVIANEAQVRQILRNLVANAVEHGGSDIRVYGDIAGSNYVVSIEDNGPGLSDELAARLSEGAVDPKAGASGVGLDVAWTLATAMDGTMEYDRVAGRTAFILTLPAADQPVADEAGALVTAEQC